MGQRLTFKIIKGGECIASIYYHWSAYTGETYLEALKLIYGLRMRGYTKECSNDDTIIMLEDILECNCIILNRGTDMEKVEIGGVDANCDREFFEIYKKKYGIDFRYCAHTSRNCGILAIGEHIKTQEYWAEELEEFNLDTETFTNNIYDVYKDINEYAYNYGLEDEDVNNMIESLPVVVPESVFGTISFDDAVDVYQRFLDAKENMKLNSYTFGKTPSGEIVTITE